VARRAVAGLAVAILAFAGHATPGHCQPRREPQQIVGRADVIDGETFRIGRQSIRIWGIDAPDDDRKAFGTRALRQIVRSLSWPGGAPLRERRSALHGMLSRSSER